MIGYSLTEENKKLLKFIYLYGGYTRKSHLNNIFKNYSHQALFNKLDKLEKMGYLTSRRLKSSSKREEKTYQVTLSACKLFLNPNSYFRKKHQEEYIYRALLKNYYLFSIHNTLSDCIIADHEERINFFYEGKFNEEYFPKKYNKDDSFIHFEEVIINLTNPNINRILHDNDNNILYDSSSKSAIILYIDQYYKDVKKQAIGLVNKYYNLIRNGGNFKINFLIITDDNSREYLYKKAIDNLIKNINTKRAINERLIKIYADLLFKIYDNDSNKLSEIAADYKSGALRLMIIKHINKSKVNIDDVYVNNIIDNLKLHGENYIREYVLKTVNNNNGSYFGSHDELKKFFMLLFALEYNDHTNIFNNENDKLFDMKVHSIDKKIYV